MEIPRLGVRWELQLPAYTTATAIRDLSCDHNLHHGSAGSATHWARPGIKPASSWILVGFITTEPQREFPQDLLLSEVVLEELWVSLVGLINWEQTIFSPFNFSTPFGTWLTNQDIIIEMGVPHYFFLISVATHWTVYLEPHHWPL